MTRFCRRFILPYEKFHNIIMYQVKLGFVLDSDCVRSTDYWFRNALSIKAQNHTVALTTTATRISP